MPGRFAQPAGVRLLSLLLVAAMLAIALVLEPLRFGVSLWPSKLPLVALLAAAFVRAARRRLD